MWELAIKYPISSIPTFLTVVPILLLMYRIGEFEKPVRYFFLYLTAKFVVEIAMFYLASESINNLALGNLLMVVTYGLIATMFYNLFEHDKYKDIIRALSLLFISVAGVDLIRDGLNETFRYTGLAHCFFIMFYCVMFFYSLIEKPKVADVTKYSIFWICAGLIIYCAPNVFILPLNHYLDQYPQVHEMDIFISIPYILEIFYMSVISFGFYISNE